MRQRPGGTKVDWDLVRQRMESAEARLARREPTEDERDAVLDQRAAALAIPPPPPAGHTLEVLEFHLGAARFGFEASQVREVWPAVDLVPLKGAPAIVAGLVNVRGRVVPVLALGSLFGLPATQETPSVAVLLAGASGDVGVLASDRPSIRRLLSAALRPMPDGASSGLDPTFVRGVTPDLLVVLDADGLLADSRLIVNQEG